MEDIESYLVAIGLLLMIAELLLGFSVILLFTLGLSLLITAALVYAGGIEPSILNLFIAVSVLDLILMVVLWKPMKYLQRDKAPLKVKNDLIGNMVELPEDVSPTRSATLHYSGIIWKVNSDESIPAGSKVIIKDVSVGTLTVGRNT
ncbi:NfeD family protein [Alteromonas sp. BZK5]|jgi:inner membrane protein|uniref:NfeD family protein n=1 Tax=Alteromonas sp. BZK5 TaxID=1904459 RepID=UPI0016536A34|nr:NfeD family protein [Alteromonas sp. BZK5]MBC6987548.1 NfeD family protein [Alteromonas sp. BZK5]